MPTFLTAQPRVPTLWVVVIGNGNYDDKAFKSLPCAVSDAMEVKKFFDRERLPAKHINILTNATSTELKATYSNWLPQGVEAQDQVFFYYSGHLALAGNGSAYVVPRDAAAGNLSGTGIELTVLKNALWGLQAKQVVLMLDACYSGICCERGEARDQTDDPIIKVFELPDKERLVITACGPKEQALEIPRFAQGAFTHFFLQGVDENMLADANHDGRVEINEAFYYLENKVKELAKRSNHAQNPCKRGTLSTPFYIKLSAAARPTQLVIQEPQELQNDIFMNTAQESITISGVVRFGPRDKKVSVGNVPATMKPCGCKTPGCAVCRDVEESFAIKIPLSEDRNSVRIAVQDQNNSLLQRKDVTISYQKPPSYWPVALWERCWHRKNAWTNEYVDFTLEEWTQLPHKEQMLYASAYQKWYAGKVDQPVKHEFSAARTNFTMIMILIPPGKFWMGSLPTEVKEAGQADDEARHKVLISTAFWMGQHEVTQGQWKAVMRDNPSKFQLGSDDKKPVEQVSWQSCQDFCNSTAMQLPTEVQWEYACRAGVTATFNSEADLRESGWYFSNSEQTTHPVGQKQPNAWGLYDMHGNVWEWCADGYETYPTGEVADPQVPITRPSRIVRGGSWNCGALNCRTAVRGKGDPKHPSDNMGMRLVRSLSER
jgi:formylglycine-generating enzyme required for sulfatase activity